MNRGLEVTTLGSCQLDDPGTLLRPLSGSHVGSFSKGSRLGGNRTHNQRIKSPLLCLVELRACGTREVFGWNASRVDAWFWPVRRVGTAGVEPAAS